MSIENSVKRDTRIEYFEKPTPTTLKRTVKDDARERIELEIGDEKQVEAFPQAKIKKWDNEVNFSIRRDNGSRSFKEQDGMIVFESPDEDVRFYELAGFEDGGLEIELLLKTKPKTNVFEFSIETKGLNFLHQSALTQEEIDRGYERPEHVVGSYAVYHSTKKNNLVGGKFYRTGKFAHIYRPKVIDASGSETWAELNVDVESSILYVIVPQEFLNKATYPVVVDPTVGYTTVGSSTGTLSNGSILVVGTEGTETITGTITEVATYVQGPSSPDTHWVQLGLWSSSGTGAPDSTTPDVVSSNFAPDLASWNTYTISESASGRYFSGLKNNGFASSSLSVRYDTTSSGKDNWAYIYDNGLGFWIEVDNYSSYFTYTVSLNTYSSTINSSQFIKTTSSNTIQSTSNILSSLIGIKIDGVFEQKQYKIKKDGVFS